MGQSSSSKKKTKSSSSSVDDVKKPDVEARGSRVSFESELDRLGLDRDHRLRQNLVEASQCAANVTSSHRASFKKVRAPLPPIRPKYYDTDSPRSTILPAPSVAGLASGTVSQVIPKTYEKCAESAVRRGETPSVNEHVNVSWQSGSSSSPESTGESEFEEPYYETCSSPNEDSVPTTEIPKTPETVSTPSHSVRLLNPPTKSFYVPRRTTPPKTKDATKQSIKPHLRISGANGSKLLSNVISDTTSRKLAKLVKHWHAIRNVADTDQLLAVKRLELPVLMSFKLVELTHSFAYHVESISDFPSCSALFEILSDITSSTFEYHKIEVMKRVVTPKFMYTLLCVVEGFHCHNPDETEFESFVENLFCIYGGVFLQLDDLATDGLAEDLTKVIESCLQFARSATENGYCTDCLDQLLCIINARDSLITAHSCFPYDILKEESVEKNIIDGAYDNFDQYLSIHYRLLKEDFQNTLREGMIQYLKTVVGVKRKMINYHLTIYPRVTLQTNLTKYALNYKIVFHDREVLLQLQNPASRRFLTGALLILTPRISPSNPTPFEYYYLVRVEDSSPLEREKPYICVSMILGPSKFTPSMDLMMAEPSQFFEPYYRVLNVIRSLDSGSFPFLKYIVELKTDVSPPAYMKTTTNLKLGRTNCSLWDDESWPNPEDVELNRGQLEGLKLALRNELAIIQGPPGTGKTYLSRKIIEILLANRSVWRNDDDGVGLIMVVCFKNQSLDQLLGGLIKAGKKVLRVGTQSKEEMLDQYNLKTLQNPNHISDKIYFQIRRKLAADELTLMDAFVKSVYVIDELENLQGLIKVRVLSTILRLNEDNFRYLENHMEEWLVPLPLAKVDKMEQLLIESRRWGDVDMEKTEPNMYLNSLQRIESELSILSSRLDFLKTSSESEVNDDVLDLTNAIAYLKRKLAAMEDGLHKLNKPLSKAEDFTVLHLKNAFESYENQPPIEELHISKRWLLYRIWISDLREYHSKSIELMSRESQNLHQRYLEIDEMLNVRKIAQCDAEVIGMTTTVAAKYHKMIECLKPKIVLVEEAAEVMEAHTIAAISKHCEHLILVGDHKQLRPMTSSHIIGREAHLDVSMYERLVRNGFPHCTLNRQYRMRPEIASLISPAVYPDLINDASVNNLPHVLGVSADLYFMDHSVSEDATPGNLSKMNIHEAEFHLAFCNYLVKQGYSPSQITILATYSEQEKYFNREKSKYPELGDVLMATVDSYQGKENDIILLSLVRSNAEGNIGFLSLQNRVNVALSRAKRGLFITGNSKNLLAKGGLWPGVVDDLSRNYAIGSSLPLKCEIHRKLTLVATARDFVPLKNGGCSKKCNSKLACGHLCNHQCHPIDRDHRDIFKCSAICCKVMDCSHPCILTCHTISDVRGCFCKSCTPKTVCETKMPCGHTCKSMAHVEDFEHEDKFRCKEPCNTVLKCGHTCNSPCHVDDIEHTKRNKCPIICEGIMPCGHQCVGKSRGKHECSDHKTTCNFRCGVAMPCGHICPRICHNNDSNHELFKCPQCKKNEEMKNLQSSNCIHGEMSSSCDIVCGVKFQCGHSCLKKCQHTADIDHTKLCKQLCGQLRDCGHACTLPCHFSKFSLHNKPSTCRTCSKQVDVTKKLPLQAIGDQSKCSHGTSLAIKCRINCGVELQCGHSCLKKCRHTGDVDHTKLCRQMCGQLRDCGHTCTLECHFQKSSLHNDSSICSKCSKQVDATKQIVLQAIGDQSQCSHGTSLTTKCKINCGVELQCGHSCLKKCRHTGDVDHTKLCRQMCGQLRDCGHTCTLECHFQKSSLHNDSSICSKCSKQVDATKQIVLQAIGDQSQCSHGTSLTTKCKIKCGAKLQCGHSCLKKCRHTGDVDHTKLCKRVCSQLLVCGHECTLKCHFPTFSLHNDPSRCSTCSKQVDATKQVVLQAIGDQSKCSHGTSLTTECREKCGVKFQCGHSCLKKCRHNADIDHTKLCKQLCGQLRDCGHACTLPCHFSKFSLHNKPTCSKCSKQVDALKQVVLQAIGDQSKCSHGTSLTTECREKCGFKFQCGHSCLKECRHTGYKTHTERCKQVCSQLLDCEHECPLPCHADFLFLHSACRRLDS